MTGLQSSDNRPGRGRVLCFALFVASLQLAGCAVGYKTFPAEEGNQSETKPDLANVRITCSYKKDNASYCYFFEYVLRTRFRVIDIESTPDAPMSGADRFTVRVEPVRERPYWNTWQSISVLSFAVIPAVSDKQHAVAFSMSAPGGQEKTFSYGYSERTYSWLPLLPFVLIAPGFYEDPSGTSIDAYQDERNGIFDGIITRFVTDAAPFISSHMPAR